MREAGRSWSGRPDRPVYPGYLADPFVLRTPTGYIAYGTVPPDAPGVEQPADGYRFRMVTSPDLVHWTDAGGALVPLPPSMGADYWAPEVAWSEGRYFLYYSVGHGDRGHHLRVAVAHTPLGPFVDAGVDLTPAETFAIDAHPYRDVDGQWYLFYAHDVLEGPRVGTMLAVDRMPTMTTLAGEARTILRPDADWEIYQRGRAMYGQTVDWHTLEGPFVHRRESQYYCFYSGGSWKDESYGVSWAVADHPLGPWRRRPGAPQVLRTRGAAVGPGHNSITTAPDGRDVMVFHAWDPRLTARRMHLAALRWTADGPRSDGF